MRCSKARKPHGILRRLVHGKQFHIRASNRLNVSLHTLLQILSLTLFEKLPLKQAVAGVEPIETNPAFYRQLNRFEF